MAGCSTEGVSERVEHGGPPFSLGNRERPAEEGERPTEEGIISILGVVLVLVAGVGVGCDVGGGGVASDVGGVGVVLVKMVFLEVSVLALLFLVIVAVFVGGGPDT